MIWLVICVLFVFFHFCVLVPVFSLFVMIDVHVFSFVLLVVLVGLLIVLVCSYAAVSLH